MELKQVVSNYKFGILYAKEGQYRETDMFSNGTYHHRRIRTPFPNSQALIVCCRGRSEHGSEAFEHFLSMIGDKIALEGWTQYRAGLDVRSAPPASPLLPYFSSLNSPSFFFALLCLQSMRRARTACTQRGKTMK